jgi:predicted RNA polymerase sigma factor
MATAVTLELERVLRESHARLLAFLSARSRDVAAAEDALSEALEAALRSWPELGVPESPDAWLLTAARRRLIDGARHERVRSAAATELLLAAEEAHGTLEAGEGLPDERLRLLFACAHPAVEVSARAPLMLQTVLGLDAAVIAAAFVVPGATMGQRLSRAKARIRESGVPFEVPSQAELPARLEAVLDAVYAAYGRGWSEPGTSSREVERDLSEEALELGALLVRALPGQAEAHGLMALMLHCQARRAARRDAAGAYVPLSAQDTERWDRRLLALGEQHLHQAARLGQLGRFQLEAAIQAAHAERAVRGSVDWPAIAALYEGLVRLAPTVGALVGRVAAVAEARGAAVAWELLSELPPARLADYQPYWAVRGHLQVLLSDGPGAAASFVRAAEMSSEAAEKKYLLDRAASCRKA